MSVHKRVNPSGGVTWFYRFDLPGSSRENRQRIRVYGFTTKKAAIEAESGRRVEEQHKRELGTTKAAPTTLSELLEEFLTQHVAKKLSPKTLDGYRECVAHLDPVLLATPINEISSLMLSREWTRLLESGGRTRRNKTPRPMSAKRVRNVAGVVSSAYSKAIIWQLVDKNPVTHSEPPVPTKKKAVALDPSQTALLTQTEAGPWFQPVYLRVKLAIGARRGEVLALRWSDLGDGRVWIVRELIQPKHGPLVFVDRTKNGDTRVVTLPESIIPILEEHRKQQEEFKRQFGKDYHDLDLIFCWEDGSPYKPNSLSASVSALCKRLNLPKGVSLHSLRHTHASILLDEHQSITTVAARLGHKSTRTTLDIYAHMMRGGDDKAARAFDEYERKHANEHRHDVQ
jgi:integrase